MFKIKSSSPAPWVLTIVFPSISIHSKRESIRRRSAFGLVGPSCCKFVKNLESLPWNPFLGLEPQYLLLVILANLPKKWWAPPFFRYSPWRWSPWPQPNPEATRTRSTPSAGHSLAPHSPKRWPRPMCWSSIMDLGEFQLVFFGGVCLFFLRKVLISIE